MHCGPPGGARASNRQMSAEMRVADQWGGNHVFFRCCCVGTVMRVMNKNGPFGSLGGLVVGSALHLAFVEVPYFYSLTHGVSTVVFCVLALLSCSQLTVRPPI